MAYGLLKSISQGLTTYIRQFPFFYIFNSALKYSGIKFLKYNTNLVRAEVIGNKKLQAEVFTHSTILLYCPFISSPMISTASTPTKESPSIPYPSAVRTPIRSAFASCALRYCLLQHFCAISPRYLVSNSGHSPRTCNACRLSLSILGSSPGQYVVINWQTTSPNSTRSVSMDGFTRCRRLVSYKGWNGPHGCVLDGNGTGYLSLRNVADGNPTRLRSSVALSQQLQRSKWPRTTLWLWMKSIAESKWRVHWYKMGTYLSFGR